MDRDAMVPGCYLHPLPTCPGSPWCDAIENALASLPIDIAASIIDGWGIDVDDYLGQERTEEDGPGGAKRGFTE